MSEDVHQKIVSFLTEEFGRGQGRQCVSVDLAGCHAGGAGVPLGAWNRDEHPDLFSDLVSVEDLASKIVMLAEDHAATFGGGSCRFELKTRQHLGGRRLRSFRIASPSGDAMSAGDDQPSATGVLQQQMRHTELHMKMSVQTQQMIIGTLQRQIESLNEENTQLRRERRDHLAELETARERKDERDYAMMIGQAAEERKDKLVGETMRLLPVVASRLLGKGATGEATPLSLILTKLGESITPSQFEGIRGQLSMQQQALLWEAMKLARETEERAGEQKGRSESGPSSGNPPPSPPPPPQPDPPGAAAPAGA